MSSTPGPRSSSRDGRGFPRFWGEERETLAPARRDRVVLERIRHQLRYVYAELPFYRRHYPGTTFKARRVVDERHRG